MLVTGGLVHRFDPENHKKLDSPDRLEWQNPSLILDWLELDGTETVVDIGSGTGFMALPLAERWPDSTVCGVDLSDKMTGILAERAAERGLKNVKTVLTDGKTIGIPDNTADIVLMVNVLHELDKDYALVNEARRILKPGSRLVLIDWKGDLTPVGPPVAERVNEEEAADIMEARDFALLAEPELYPHHYTLVYV